MKKKMFYNLGAWLLLGCSKDELTKLSSSPRIKEATLSLTLSFVYKIQAGPRSAVARALDP